MQRKETMEKENPKLDLIKIFYTWLTYNIVGSLMIEPQSTCH